MPTTACMSGRGRAVSGRSLRRPPRRSRVNRIAWCPASAPGLAPGALVCAQLQLRSGRAVEFGQGPGRGGHHRLKVIRLWVSSAGRPLKIGTQTVIDRATVVRSWVAFALVPKSVVGRLWKHGIVVAHHVRHGDADALLLVIKHQHGTTVGAEADFQRAVRVAGIEGHPLHLFRVVGLHVAVIEEGDMRRVLAGYGLADVAVTFVVVNWFGGCSDVHMFAAARISCSHGLSSRDGLVATGPLLKTSTGRSSVMHAASALNDIASSSHWVVK